MSIEVKCPHCNTVHHVNDRMAGRRVRCPHCDSPVEVVQPDSAVAASTELSSDTDRESDAAAVVDAGDGLQPVVQFDGASPLEFTIEDRRASDVAMGLPGPPSLPHHQEEDEEDEALPIKLKAQDSELDMTPMVDVTFLLLIFFMVTAAFSLQKSIESPRQQSDAPSLNTQEQDPEELDVITVQIDERGSFLVLAPDWERETPGKQNLIRSLKEARGDSSNPVKLVIEVHEMARLQALVDCMDAGAICDYGELQVTQVDGFE